MRRRRRLVLIIDGSSGERWKRRGELQKEKKNQFATRLRDPGRRISAAPLPPHTPSDERDLRRAVLSPRSSDAAAAAVSQTAYARV